MTHKEDTRFKPGKSGNPRGRPRGAGWVGRAREQLQEAWDGKKQDGSDGLRQILISKALDGDMAAIRIVAERVCPPIRASEPPVPIDLPNGSLTDRATAVLDALGRGELNPSQAAQVMQALGALAKVIETDELAKRIEALEEASNARS